MLAWIRCYRGGHVPVRHPVGGFRCSQCGKPGADLSDFGFQGYVPLVRTLFSREHGERTRTHEFRE